MTTLTRKENSYLVMLGQRDSNRFIEQAKDKSEVTIGQNLTKTWIS